ncbi:hypothetical protein LEP3755_26590 [Leptolyngbya sp. NIES-3755]|nr:hypothetical protein LEP3755_26590 [Leptolyngbya sp. NIES-3755]
MPRQKRSSQVLTKAEIRIAGLNAIDPNLDFGKDRSVFQLVLLSNKLRSKLTALNEAVAVADATRNEVEELEKQVQQLSDQLLTGVGFEYGKDSQEYKTAGGVRIRDRVRKSIKTRLKNANTPDAVEKAETN